jgi:hypothetical protein
MEPEPEAEGYYQNGRAPMNYVDLDYTDELTASMRPYASLVHDVRITLLPSCLQPTTPLGGELSCWVLLGPAQQLSDMRVVGAQACDMIRPQYGFQADK